MTDPFPFIYAAIGVVFCIGFLTWRVLDSYQDPEEMVFMLFFGVLGGAFWPAALAIALVFFIAGHLAKQLSRLSEWNYYRRRRASYRD